MNMFRKTLSISVLTMAQAQLPIQALPVSETIISGQAQFDQSAQELNVLQHSDFLHVQYDTFDIASDERVTFTQPNSQSIVINQVLNADPTQIAGQLSANGQLFLLSPGGLVIHQGATIEATSFFASTLQPESINENGIQFSGSSNQVGIFNQGVIDINGGGQLQLLSNAIINHGDIKNGQGDTSLSVADGALVKFSNDLFAIEVDQAALNGVIDNTGTISSQGGKVEISALVRDQINELVINNQGEISATSAWEENGDIYIGSNEGDIENHGTIDSFATENTDQAAHIQINGDRIANVARISNNGSGTGDAGSIELHATDTVALLAGSEILANGDVAGDGGNVKVFSPNSAIFRSGASIEAEAGFQLGDGGFVDVSGWQHVEIFGRVSTLALNGINGQFLIDPYNITISGAGDNNVSFAGGVYAPGNNGAIINVTTLENNLKAGNVQVVTTGAGAENGDISVSIPINLDGTHGNTLELIAEGGIVLNGDINDQALGSLDQTNVILNAKGGSITGGGVITTSGGDISLILGDTVTLGAGGNLDLSLFQTEGGNLFVQSTTSSISLLSDLDLDGLNGSTLSLQSSANLNLDFNIQDTTLGTSDVVNIELISDAGNVIIAGGKVVNSYGGNMSLSSSGAVTVGAGGTVDFTQVLAGGGNLDIISTANTVSLLNDLDIDGFDGSYISLQANANLDVGFNIVDSVLASNDSVSVFLISDTGDITITNGKSVNSYGGSINVLSNADAWLSQLVSGGGLMNIRAHNVHDNGASGDDINAQGGVVTFNVSGNIGGTSDTTALEVREAILNFNSTAGANNQNIYLNNNQASDITINNVDYNGSTTFNFNVNSSNTGDVIFSGEFSDSNDTGDMATINVNTTGVGSDIRIYNSAQLRSRGGNIHFNTADTTADIIIGASAVVRSQGGDITYDAGRGIGMAYTKSDGGAINLTADYIYDGGDVRSDIVADGGVVTIIASDNVGGINYSEGLEIESATLDYTALTNNQSVFLNLVGSGNTLNLRDIDFNNANGLSFNVGTDFSSTINVTGTIADSDTGTVDSASFDIYNSSLINDITINSNATLDVGPSGTVIVSSSRDIYLSSIVAGTGGVYLTAENNIIDNGDIVNDVSTSGDIYMSVGGSIADGDNIHVIGSTLNLNLGSGDHNIVSVEDINLGDINIDGANGAQLSVVGAQDVILTGTIIDANGSDDKIDLTLGASTPGFVIFPDAGYTVPGSLTFWDGTAGIKNSTDERVSITADSVISVGTNFSSNTGPLILDLTVDSLDIRDDLGLVDYEINNTKNLALVDLNSDGEVLVGRQFKFNVNGNLILPNTGLNGVDDQLWIIANNIDDPDADNIITIQDSNDAGTEFNLIVDLTGANDVVINTVISHFDGSIVTGGALTINNTLSAAGLDLSTDLNSDGNTINGAGDIAIITDGTLNISDTGISTTGNLSLIANEINDSDNEINVTADTLYIEYLAPTSTLYTLNVAANALNASMNGDNASLRIQSAQGLSIEDLNGDGASLSVNDGYAWLEIAGDISLSDTISVVDRNVDGNELGWMYVSYQGSASFGENGSLDMTIDGSLESGTPSELNVTGSQLLVRQTGGQNASNLLSFNGSEIDVIGGDAVFDIANDTNNISGFGDITMSSDSRITASNVSTDSTYSAITYVDGAILGTLNVAAGRNINMVGLSQVEIEELPTEVIDQIDQVVSDVIKDSVGDAGQSVAEDIQEETVSAIESSPNVNVALNEMFSGCRQSNSEDSRCQMKSEISRFLGRFLMGGSMPKTVK